MKIRRWFSLMCFLCSSVLFSQHVKIIDSVDDFKATLSHERFYVVNFWATWCAPCIKELPYFEELQLRHPELKVILISLDSEKDLQSKLIPFLKKKKITTEVILLKDKNYNNWLPKVDPNWSGAIPATWLIRNDKVQFVEREFESYAELEDYSMMFNQK